MILHNLTVSRPRPLVGWQRVFENVQGQAGVISTTYSLVLPNSDVPQWLTTAATQSVVPRLALVSTILQWLAQNERITFKSS